MVAEKDIRAHLLIKSLGRLSTLDGFFEVMAEADKLPAMQLLPFEAKRR